MAKLDKPVFEVKENYVVIAIYLHTPELLSEFREWLYHRAEPEIGTRFIWQDLYWVIQRESVEQVKKWLIDHGVEMSKLG